MRKKTIGIFVVTLLFVTALHAFGIFNHAPSQLTLTFNGQEYENTFHAVAGMRMEMKSDMVHHGITIEMLIFDLNSFQVE